MCVCKIEICSSHTSPPTEEEINIRRKKVPKCVKTSIMEILLVMETMLMNVFEEKTFYS